MRSAIIGDVMGIVVSHTRTSEFRFCLSEWICALCRRGLLGTRRSTGVEESLSAKKIVPNACRRHLFSRRKLRSKLHRPSVMLDGDFYGQWRGISISSKQARVHTKHYCFRIRYRFQNQLELEEWKQMRCQREVVTFSVNSSTRFVSFYDVDDNLK